MKFVKLISFIALSCCFANAGAQRLNFENFSTRNGLSANEISCIYEDKEHFLWVGTRDGLNRFDGRIFKVFRNDPASTNSLSGNNIVDIVQDKSGIYWVATKDGGLSRYDPNALSGHEFKQYRNNPKDPSSIATNRLLCLYDWDDTYLLIGAEVKPAIFLNKKTGEFTYWDTKSPKFGPAFCKASSSVTQNWVQHIVGAGNTVYMSMLLNGQMFKVDKTTGSITELHHTSTDVLSISYFTLTDGKIWMSCWNPAGGLFMQPDHFVDSAQKVSAIDDILTCNANLNKGYMLVGTRASGLFLVNKQTGAWVQYEKKIDPYSHALKSNKISAILVDSQGAVWIGTLAGLSRFDNHAWLFSESEFANPETDCTVLSCHRFNDSSIAISTSKGIFLSDSSNHKFTQIVLRNRGHVIIPDYMLETDLTGLSFNPHSAVKAIGGQEILLGTEMGFYFWDRGASLLGEFPILQPGTKDPGDFYQNDNFQVKQIVRSRVHGTPVLWMPVLGYGLACYQVESDSLVLFLYDQTKPKSISNNLARKVAIDKSGNVWIATAGGLNRWRVGNSLNENNFDRFINEPGNKNSIPGNDINDVWCDDKFHVWVTINGGGLCEFDGHSFTQYLPGNPASSRVFLGMHADHRGRIWIITKNGLEVFDTKEKKFFHMDVNDGSFNTTLAPQFSNERNGLVSFATSSGNRVFTFLPDRMEFNMEFPPLYLVSMSSFGKSYLHEASLGEAHLSTKERFVNFTISALQFSSPGSVRFQYKLEGLDDNWTTSEDGEIKYTNLPWGHFKLVARVTNLAGQFGGEKVLAQFVIATPFYATWWFISLCIITGSALVYAFYRYRINQLLALQKVRNKIARDLHDDIGSTLGSISFFSEAAKQQLESANTTGTEKMLNKIGDTSREMIDNMSDIVWSVNPQNDSVKHLANRMRVFAGDLVASSGIQLHFDYPSSIDDVKLSMEQRKNIFLIFKETVYNSVKYATCKNIHIKLSKRDKGLLLKIWDDGKGFDVNNYTSKNGNGLRNMKYRAEEIGAVYKIESSANGTVTGLNI